MAQIIRAAVADLISGKLAEKQLYNRYRRVERIF